MSKIFDVDFVKGTFIDEVADNVGVAAGCGLEQREKGLALCADGSASSVLFDPLSSYTNEISVIAWAKPMLASPNQYVVSQAENVGANNDFILYYDSDRFRFQIIGSNANAPVPIGKWYHVVGTYDGSNIKIYIDGVLKQTIGYSNTLNKNADKLSLASRRINSGTISDYFKGDIGMVEIYSHILTPTEISENYSKFLKSSALRMKKSNFHYPKPTNLSNETGLVAAFNFENNLIDISGNGNDGTKFNSPLFSPSGLRFDGVNDYVSIGVAGFPTGSSDRTIMFRFKPYSIPISFGSITSYGQDVNNRSFNVGWSASSPRIIVGKYGANASLANLTNIPFNKESTIAVTLSNDSDISYYLDGEADGTATLTGINTVLVAGYISRFAGSLYSNVEMIDIRYYNRTLTDQEIKNYHNYFAKQVVLYEDFRYEGADGLTKIPHGWIPGTGTFEINEDTVEGKYMECNGNGTISISYGTKTSVDAVITYDVGAGWVTVSGTLANLISSLSWLSLSGDNLVFNMTSGNKVSSILVNRDEFK